MCAVVAQLESSFNVLAYDSTVILQAFYFINKWQTVIIMKVTMKGAVCNTGIT